MQFSGQLLLQVRVSIYFGSKLAWSCKLVKYMLAIVLISCVITRRLHVLLGIKNVVVSMSLEYVTITVGVAKHSWTSWPRPLQLCPYEAFSKVGNYVLFMLTCQ